MNSAEILQKQRDFFNSNKTKDPNFRIEQLKKLKQLISENEDKLYDAIYADFGKSEFETYTTEISQVYHEINQFIKNIKRWSKKKRVRTNLVNLPGRSYIMPEPLGSVLVIGAWNYPYGLSLTPMVSALGAGNTVILKPSELPNNTSRVMAEIINSNFSSEYLFVVEGGVEETTELLKNRFDKIFFTGSTTVGKIIYQKAAEHLTPVILELGGKCPTFVFADCNIKKTAKRIVWAKFLNAGQTCIAPDYILVDESIEQAFIKAVKNEIEAFHDSQETLKENYLQIINDRNFDRLVGLIDDTKVYCGGEFDKSRRYISPTVLENISFEDDIMTDEIFGPILPVISFTNLDETIKHVKSKPKPLACYIYSNNKSTINKILKEISFGGGAINESIMHIVNGNLPFGGVGMSGFGNYHGKAGFDSFSHNKSIFHKTFWFEPPLKYYPYTKNKLKIIKWLFE